MDFHTACLLLVYLITTTGQRVSALNYRLVAETDKQGIAEVEYNGEYGTLCVDSWANNAAANVLCRQLGFSSGEVSSIEYTPEEGRPAWNVKYVECPDNATDDFDVCVQGVLEGSYASGGSPCKPDRVPAGVQCFGTVKFMRSFYRDAGQVNVMAPNDGLYYTVCRDGFDDTAANIACRELGYAFGRPACCPIQRSVSAIRLTGYVTCSGNESSIMECLRTQVTCQSMVGAYFVCSRGEPLPAPSSVSIERDAEGQLLQIQGGYPSSICSDPFSDNEAVVFCRSKGFSRGVARKIISSLDSSMWGYRFICKGNEQSLDACASNQINIQFCTGSAAVHCSNEQEWNVQLVGTNRDNVGFIRLEREGTGGLMCIQKQLEEEYSEEAGTICRQLNTEYVDGEIMDGTEGLDVSEFENVWATQTKCQEGVSNIDACDWKYSEAIRFNSTTNGTICPSDYMPLRVACLRKARLGCDANSNVGLFNVNVGRRWRYVCLDARFGEPGAPEAIVACRSLQAGYNAGRVLRGSLFASGFQMDYFPLRNVRCTGSENSLDECQFTTTEPNCLNGEVPVALYCFNTRTATHVDNTIDYLDGRVHIYRQGMMSYAGIPDNGWAQVICRQRGFSSGQASEVRFPAKRRNGACFPTLIERIDCDETAFSMEDCNVVFTDMSTYVTSSSRDEMIESVVHCVNERLLDDQVRLIGGTNPSYGLFEVKLLGQWGAVCDRSNTISNTEATKFCKRIDRKFVSGAAVPASSVTSVPIQETWAIYTCDSSDTYGLCLMGSWEPGQSGQVCVDATPVAVTCYTEVRLSSEISLRSGAVIVTSSDIDRISYVCSGGINQFEADVVCKDMGYDNGRLLDDTNVIWRLGQTGGAPGRSISCRDDARGLSDCSIPAIICPKRNRVSAVECRNGDSEDIDLLSVKLEAPADYNDNSIDHSVVLVYKDGYWGYINALYWERTSALVVCKQLGFTGMDFHSNVDVASLTKKEVYPLVIDDIRCDGNESSLSSCLYQSPSSSTDDTWTGRIATVKCNGERIEPPTTEEISTEPSKPNNNNGVDNNNNGMGGQDSAAERTSSMGFALTALVWIASSLA